MDSAISDFIKTCDKCQKTRTDVHPKPDLLTPLPICTEPNQRIHADLFGALVTSGRNKKYILCMTDACTKYVELVALPNKEAETVADAIFSHWICRFGIPVEVITDQGKEFCNKLTDELFQLMEMKHGRTSAYHPQCNAQAEVANKTIAKFLRNQVDTSTLNWEIFLPPLMFSYNTSFHRTIQTAPFFLTFGQNAVQPDFDQNNLQEKFIQENTPEEKFQILQEARQMAWRNAAHQQTVNQEVYDRKAAPHTFMKNQWVLEKSFDYLHKNTKLAAKYKGPFQILRILPHNNVEIRISERRKSIVHANKLKPYHSKGEFQTFEDYFPDQTFDFEKQGGEQKPKNYFNEEKDFTENNFESPEEQKFGEEKAESESTEELPPPKRGRGRPRKTEKKTFPTLKDIDERYQLRSRKREGNTQQNQYEESESENQEGEEWIKAMIRRDIERRVRVMQSQYTPPAQVQLIKINYLSQINPFITECRKIIKACPKGVIKENYPNWNDNQIINYWWSGDINEGPDDPNLISLADHPYLPSSIFGNQNQPVLLEARPVQGPQLEAQPAVRPEAVALDPPNILEAQTLDINENLFEDEDGDDFFSPPSSPAPSTTTATNTQSAGGGDTRVGTPVSTRTSAGFVLSNVRPALLTAPFRDACQMSDFNPDERAFFQEAFYSNRGDAELLSQTGRETRSNPSGLRSYLKKTFKK